MHEGVSQAWVISVYMFLTARDTNHMHPCQPSDEPWDPYVRIAVIVQRHRIDVTMPQPAKVGISPTEE